MILVAGYTEAPTTKGNMVELEEDRIIGHRAMADRHYYDFHWRQTGGEEHPYIAEKTRIILGIIPPDVRTIIDVGCGDGAITNVLAESYTIVGGDISQEGLKNLSVKAQPIVSSTEYA